MATTTSTCRGKGGVWTGTFTADTDDKKDKPGKCKGKSNAKTSPSTGSARDRCSSKKREGKPNAKAKAKPAGGPKAQDNAAAPPAAAVIDVAPDAAAGFAAAQVPVEKRDKVRHDSGKFSLAGGNPDNLVGIQCHVCKEDYMYSTLFHRTCVV